MNVENQPDTETGIMIPNQIDYTPKVSVIIPVYNVENYLRECLDSVINQTLKEIEIICIDNGSSDNSLEILKEYAAKDPRITVISQANSNAGVARNTGLSVAEGKYVGFVDSDDCIAPDMYSKLYNKCEKHGLDISICQYHAFDSKTKDVLRVWGINKGFLKKYALDKDNVLKVRPQDPIFQLSNPAPWNKIYRRDFIIENKISFQSIILSNDVAFTQTALSYAQSIGLIIEELYYYRTNTKSALTDKRNANPCIFYNATKELYTRLVQRDKLKDFQQSFLNLVVTDCIFNYEKVEDRNKQGLRHLLINEVFPKYGISKENLSLLYTENSRVKIQELLQAPSENAVANDSPKISVIIPVYNTEPYLRECMDSILNQTMREIEVICIDDGSTDRSLDILREYQSKDERVTVLTQNNLKQGEARNKGLKIARGEYIQFLDSDDYIDLRTCEKLYQKCKSLDLDMLSFRGTNFDNNTKENLGNRYYELRYLPAKWNKEVFNLQDAAAFVHKMAVSAALTIYKHSFLLEHNITFPGKVYYEDNLFFVKAITQAKRVGLDKTLYYYRRLHSDSTTQNYSKHFADCLKIVDMVLDYLKTAHVRDDIYALFRAEKLDMAKNFFKKFSAKDQDKYRKALIQLLERHADATHMRCSLIKIYILFPIYLWKLSKMRKKYAKKTAKRI